MPFNFKCLQSLGFPCNAIIRNPPHNQHESSQQ